VLVFADFIPPIALSMFAVPTPGSSLTWMLELLRDRYDDLGLDDWRVDAELIAARDGYTNQSVMLWGTARGAGGLEQAEYGGVWVRRGCFGYGVRAVVMRVETWRD
jgi:hypothetical protein